MRTVKQHTLITRYPTFYHVAELGSWPSIQQHGLLSTSAVLDTCDLPDEQRIAIECQRRPEAVHLDSPALGRIVIRDQKPLSEANLLKCLDGTTPSEWITMLNGLVFFWPNEKRLLSLLNARANADRMHTVIAIRSRNLIDLHARDILLGPINSGTTIFNAARRGPHTFQTILDYPFDARVKSHGNDAVVEVAVRHSVPTLAAMVESVRIYQGSRVVEHIYTSRPESLARL